MADPINAEALEPIANPGDPVVTGNLIIDSKFRRETSNFKINFDMSSVDLTSEGPVLIKYIEKNLKPEELLGVIVSLPMPPALGGTAISSIANVGVNADGTYTLIVGASGGGRLYYVPSTGALSLNGPYVEEEEGGESNGSDDRDNENPDIPISFDPGTLN